MNKLKLGIISSVIGLLLFVALVTTVNMAKADYNQMYYGTIIEQNGNTLVIELDKMDEFPIIKGDLVGLCFNLDCLDVDFPQSPPPVVVTSTPGCENPDENPNC